MRKPWNPSEIALIKENYYKFSAGIIAKELGRSRESVIGKANRLIKRGEIKFQKNPDPITVTSPKKKKEHAPIVRIKQVSFRHKKLADLNAHECRFPAGRGRATTFCGCTVLEGKSYCGYHAKIAYHEKEKKVII